MDPVLDNVPDPAQGSDAPRPCHAPSPRVRPRDEVPHHHHKEKNIIHHHGWHFIVSLTRSRAEATFMDPEFQENIEQYFVENIKVGHFYVHKGGRVPWNGRWMTSF